MTIEPGTHWTSPAWWDQLLEDWFSVIPASFMQQIYDRAANYGWDISRPWETHVSDLYVSIPESERNWLTQLVIFGKTHAAYPTPDNPPVSVPLIPHWTSTYWLDQPVADWYAAMPVSVQDEFVREFTEHEWDFRGYWQVSLRDLWTALPLEAQNFITNIVRLNQPLLPYDIPTFPGLMPGYVPHWTEDYWLGQPVWAWYQAMPEDIRQAVAAQWTTFNWADRTYYYRTVGDLIAQLQPDQVQWLNDMYWLNTAIWVEDEDSVWGLVIAIAFAVLMIGMALIPAVAAAAAAVLSSIVETVGSVFAAIDTVLTGVGGLVTQGATQTLLLLGYTVEDIAFSSLTASQMLYASMAASVEGLGITFGTFLSAIHYATILGINEVAILVSPEWREVMKDIYRSIETTSQALGLGATFMLLALQNSRNIILHSSQFVGMSYDLAEVEWVSLLTTFLRRTQYTMRRYRGAPHRIFYDLADLMEKEAYNGGTGMVRTIIETLSIATKDLGILAKDINSLMADFRKFAADLPAEAREWFNDWFGPIDEAWRGFYNDEYLPFWKRYEEFVVKVGLAQVATGEKLADIVRKLLHPGTTMIEINDLDFDERRTEETLIHEVSTRVIRREIAEVDLLSSPQFSRMRDASTPRPGLPALPPWQVDSRPAAVMLRPQPGVAPVSTWSVGDY